MWLRMMRAWLVGAAVTIAAPDDGSPVGRLPSRGGEATAAGGQRREAGPETGRQKAPLWLDGEPRLQAVLADPIVGLLMRSDRVTSEDMAGLIETARTALGERREWRDPMA